MTDGETDESPATDGADADVEPDEEENGSTEQTTRPMIAADLGYISISVQGGPEDMCAEDIEPLFDRTLTRAIEERNAFDERDLDDGYGAV